MSAYREAHLTPIHWVASTHDDLVAFPRAVKHTMGVALMMAQAGGKHPAAKPLKGFRGAGVLEVVDDHERSTYRVVYTVRFAAVVYVLHAFKKKSKRGIATPKKELDLIRSRLKDRRGRPPSDAEPAMTKGTRVTRADGNVFAELGLEDADELKAKAELVIQIIQIIEQRGLKQVEAAELMGIDQPKVSQLVRGKLDGFSMERLYRFLNALGMDVEIVLKPAPKGRRGAHLRVRRPAGLST